MVVSSDENATVRKNINQRSKKKNVIEDSSDASGSHSEKENKEKEPPKAESKDDEDYSSESEESSSSSEDSKSDESSSGEEDKSDDEEDDEKIKPPKKKSKNLNLRSQNNSKMNTKPTSFSTRRRITRSGAQATKDNKDNASKDSAPPKEEPLTPMAKRTALGLRSKKRVCYTELLASPMEIDHRGAQNDNNGSTRQKSTQGASKGRSKVQSRGNGHAKRKHYAKQEEDESGEDEDENPKKKEKRSSESDDEDSEPEEDEGIDDDDSDENKVIDKILGQRKSSKNSDEIEYLVKWKGMSYLHTSWVSASELEKDTFGNKKLQRHIKQTIANGVPLPEDEDNYFNTDFLQVDRVLAKREILGKNKKSPSKIRYLVKWQSCPYSESTWESAKDINDDEKLAMFALWNKPPPKGKGIKPPNPSAFTAMTESPLYKNDHELRPYQLEGLNWLVHCWHNQRNCILADEMGLGKTVQSVSILEHLYSQRNIRGPFLVIVPLSTITHWKREFEAWTDMNAILYHGNSESRDIIKKYEWYYTDNKGKKIDNAYKFHVIITTYEMVMTDLSTFQKVRWKYLVVDEAHRLKNKSCKLGTGLKSLTYERLLFLTGTPIQNNTEELWTLLNYINPKEFNDLDAFLKQFGNLKDSTQVESLHQVLRPYLLRRMKEHVEKSIIPKEETIVEVELTNIQKKYYRAIYERNFSILSKGKGTNVPSLLNVMMELRKCCNHPYLIRGVEEDITAGLETAEDVFNVMIQSSGKLVLIDKLLPKLKQGGHKVLIFSQMVRVLDILEDYLVHRGFTYERLDGGIRGNDRQAAIDRFSSPNSDKFVFLLSTRAGGLGINLTAASTVILFDSDWNPQNDVQAQARCHRIGQTQMVKVYRLITRGTYEMQMFDRSSKKLGLDQAVLSKINNSLTETDSKKGNAPSALDKNTIDSLLKYGAYDLLSKDDDASNRFCEEDIDRILERATVIRTENSTDTGFSNFSKASFTSSTAVPDLDINDPDFWKKILPNAKHMPNPLIQKQPRERKRVQRFGNEEDENSADELLAQEEDDASDYEENKEEGTAEDGTAAPKVTTIKHWRGWESVRFRKALLQFGFGRWKEIRERAKVNPLIWTLNDLRLYAEAFLKKCILAAGYTDDEAKILESLINIGKEEMAAQLIDFEREEAERKLRKELEKKEKEEKERKEKEEKEKQGTEEGPQQAPQSEPKEKQQVELTISNNAEAPSDPMDTSTTTSTTMNATTNDDVMETDSSPSSQTPATNPFETDHSLCNQKFVEFLQRHSKKLLNRLDQVARIGELIRTCQVIEEDGSVRYDLEKLIIPESVPAFETREWWGPTEDRHLLYGAYKHGYGCYDEIKDDPTLCFYGKVSVEDEGETKSGTEEEATDKEGKEGIKQEDEVPKQEVEAPKESENDKPKQEEAEAPKIKVEDEVKSVKEETKAEKKEEGTVHKWPSHPGILNQRISRLLRSFGKLKKQKEKAAKTQQRIKAKEKKEEQKAKRKEELAEQWSKREKQDFYRCLITMGVPTDAEGNYMWQFVKEKANLKKKPLEMIEPYYMQFLTSCRKVISSHQPTTPQPFAPQGKAEPKEEEEGGAASDLTYAQCKRVVQRIMLLSNIRTKVLNNKKLDKRLKSAHGSPSLPVWWVPGEHDKALLQGVDRHGFGQWEDICTDPQLPFFQLYKQMMEKKQEHSKPSEHGVLIHSSSKEEMTDADNKEEEVDREDERDEKDEEDKEEKEEKEDGDKEDDEGKEKKAGEKRKRQKKESVADAIQFPKDKAALKRLETLISLVVMPKVKHHHSTSSEASKKKQATLQFSKANNGNISGHKREREDDEEVVTKQRRKTNDDAPKKKYKKKDGSAPIEYKPLPMDENGKVHFPILLGVLTIEKLGEVCTKPGWHSDKYIWPKGFTSTRVFSSTKNPEKKVKYKCEIVEGDGEQPVFKITPEDDPNHPIVASSASSAWKTVVERVNNMKTEETEKRQFASVSGPEYFGYSQAAIAKLIQELPGADKLEKFKSQVYQLKSKVPPKQAEKQTDQSAEQMQDSVTQLEQQVRQQHSKPVVQVEDIVDSEEEQKKEKNHSNQQLTHAELELVPSSSLSHLTNGVHKAPTKDKTKPNTGPLDHFFKVSSNANTQS